MANQKAATYEFNVKGEVQGVGFRRTARKTAQKLNISGYVQNLPDGSVKIIAQSDDEQSLVKFERSISLFAPPIKVEQIEKKILKSSRKYAYFKIQPGSYVDELQEGFGSMESQFNDYRAEFRDYRTEFRSFADRTDENFGKMDGKYGEISQKLTTILETLERESLDTKRELTRAVDSLVAAVEKSISNSKS
ncbi:MAG: acylphosphatase [Nitrososphaerales archaeon]